MLDLEDISGKMYNYLKVIEFDHKETHGLNVEYYWKCKCTGCGNIILVSRKALTRGRKSCGCKSNIAHVGSSYHGGVKTHGMSKTRFYKIYRKMNERCNLEKDTSYDLHNISICDSWLGEDGFTNFKEDMYESYLVHVEKYGEKDTSIDRIDVLGNYEPDNCKWSTIKEQANNKTNNVCFTFNGMTKTMSEWADYLGWSYCTLANRHKRGWGLERMLTEPPKYQKVKNTKKTLS